MIQEILDLWFEGVGDAGLDPKSATALRWFAVDAAFDASLRERFGATLDRAARGELGAWCADPKGALAFVILCDQLARNIHRGTPRAFATDPLALHVTLLGIERGEHAALRIPERIFFLMPLMHSESLEVHDIARREFGAVVRHAEAEAPGFVGQAKNTVDYEERHRVILERFGRYPHRNQILARPSTPEELTFLEQPGSSF